MNQSGNSRSGNGSRKPVYKFVVIIVVAILVWVAFNEMVNVIAKKINEEAARTTNQYCASLSDYKKRVNRAFSAYVVARAALTKEIRMANYMSSPSTSIKYNNLNDADMNAERREGEFSKLVRLKGTFADALSCHVGKDASKVKLYLYALSNLSIADNLLFQAHGEISAKCNPNVSAYKPLIDAANRAVAMAKQDISGDINSQARSDYLVRMPGELTSIHKIKNMCR